LCRPSDYEHVDEPVDWRRLHAFLIAAQFRFEHLVRYVGWYSTRCRGQRARAAASAVAVQAAEDGQLVAARARSAWARMMHKVYEVDALECPSAAVR